MILSLHLFVDQITSLNERLFENVLLQLAIRVDLFLHQLHQIDIYLMIFSILITSQSGSTESWASKKSESVRDTIDAK